MSPPQAIPTITIFGATAGTGLLTLKKCLAAGHSVNALARTPSKLESLVSEYPNLLRVTKGDIHDTPSIKEALVHGNFAADIVISTIGMPLHMDGIKVASPDPTICEVGTRNILEKLSDLQNENMAGPSRPSKLIILSTTGISERRDIPLMIKPFYHWGLAIPHNDKKKMEDIVIDSKWPWLLIRPSFLLDGESKGLAYIRTGAEIPSAKSKAEHAIGYTIRREDVALWIYEECVSGSGHWDRWCRKCVSLTY